MFKRLKLKTDSFRFESGRMAASAFLEKKAQKVKKPRFLTFVYLLCRKKDERSRGLKSKEVQERHSFRL